jgi:glycosyltransferase involved in cell wall biosynthesis
VIPRRALAWSPICEQALRLDPDCQNPVPYEVLALEAAIAEADDFDVIHFHEACLHLPWTRRIRCATVTTMHGRLDLRDLEPLYREYVDVPLVSISHAQREPMPWANWRATVYHGLPDDLYRFHPEPGRYLAFLGRICPEKRVDRAIAIAKRAGVELKIAAKVDAADEEYSRPRSGTCWTTRWSSSSARSATARRRGSSAARRPCSCRSAGRSRSDWS